MLYPGTNPTILSPPRPDPGTNGDKSSGYKPGSGERTSGGICSGPTLLLVVAAELALHRQLALSTSSTGMDIQNTDHDAQDPRVKLESGPHETTADGSYTDSDLILDARQFAEVVVDCK